MIHDPDLIHVSSFRYLEGHLLVHGLDGERLPLGYSGPGSTSGHSAPVAVVSGGRPPAPFARGSGLPCGRLGLAASETSSAMWYRSHPVHCVSYQVYSSIPYHVGRLHLVKNYRSVFQKHLRWVQGSSLLERAE